MLTAAPTQNKRIIALLAALLVGTAASAQTYEPTLIPPQINGSPNTMTPLNLGDDNTRNIALGFEFEYWGQTFTDAWVSSNGFVSFQTGAHLCCSGRPIELAQRNTIYGYWSDLISFTGNPYYRRSDGSILFGWYGTNEYGTNNPNTFEIGLFADGKIQFNYGSLNPGVWRDFTAGITGPTADDNIQLFYGRNTQLMQNQSGILSWIVPVPEAVPVDCRVTPMDPSCPPAAIDVTPDPVVSVAEAVADAVEQSVELESEEVEEILETATVALEQAEESVATAELADPVEEPEVTEEAPAREAEAVSLAERLDPDQVAALAAGGMDVFEMPEPEQASTIASTGSDMGSGTQQQFGGMQETQDGSSSGTFTTQVRFDTSFGGVFGPTVSVTQSASPLDIAVAASSPLSVANTVEILGLGSPAPASSVGSAPQTDSGISEGESETIAEMSAVPGFAAYTQASLQDRADFYAIRDIYRRRVLRDANFEMYRMMQTNNARWQQMVDEQYE